MNFISWRILLKRIHAIKFFLRDKEVKLWKKLLVVFGIVYLISPIDLVPAPVLVFSVVDDVVLWIFILVYLKDELDRYWLGEKEEAPEKKYHGKNIIDGVEFEVRNHSPETGEGNGKTDGGGSGGDGEV